MLQNFFVIAKLADILFQVIDAQPHFHKYNASDHQTVLENDVSRSPYPAHPEIQQQGLSRPATS